MSPCGHLDISGVVFTVFGMAICIWAIIYEPIHTSVAAAFVTASGLALLFWVGAAVLQRDRHNVWPIRFPQPHGNVGAVNGMIVWWCVVGCVCVVVFLGMWRGADGFWFYVGACATSISSIRIAYAYSEHGLRIMRRWNSSNTM